MSLKQWINQSALTSCDGKKRPLWKSCFVDFTYPAVWTWKLSQSLYYRTIIKCDYFLTYVSNRFFPPDIPFNTLCFNLTSKDKTVTVPVEIWLKNAKYGPGFIPKTVQGIEELVEDVEWRIKVDQAMTSLDHRLKIKHLGENLNGRGNC
jgi:hypothetical protein